MQCSASNSISASTPSQTPLGEPTAPPYLLAGWVRGSEGNGGEETRGERRKRRKKNPSIHISGYMQQSTVNSFLVCE